jgi:hypothetical protein
MKPVGGFALLQAKEEGNKITRMNSMLRQFVLYLCLIVVMMTICYMYHTEDTYLMVDFTNRVLLEGRIYNRSKGILTMGATDSQDSINFFKIERYL